MNFRIFVAVTSFISMEFTLPSGEALPFQPGLPAGYQGAILNGATSSFSQSAFGYIVMQELRTENVTLRKIMVHWNKAQRIMCHYNLSNGLFTRVVLNNSLHEYVKGAGEIYLKKEQFSILAGSKWTGLLAAEKPGEHHFVDIAWSAAFLQNPAIEHYSKKHIDYGFPERLMGAAQTVNSKMLELLSGLHHFDFSAPRLLNEQMKKYFGWMNEEFRMEHSLKKHMKLSDWENIHRARQLIDLNMGKHFTIPEICKTIGINDFKLKRLFPKVTGFKVDEYRKYQLCIRAGKKIIQEPDEPLKSFCSMAGYSNLTNFIRGYRKLCSCKPGELREEAWDVDGLSNL